MKYFEEFIHLYNGGKDYKIPHKYPICNSIFMFDTSNLSYPILDVVIDFYYAVNCAGMFQIKW